MRNENPTQRAGEARLRETSPIETKHQREQRGGSTHHIIRSLLALSLSSLLRLCKSRSLSLWRVRVSVCVSGAFILDFFFLSSGTHERAIVIDRLVVLLVSWLACCYLSVLIGGTSSYQRTSSSRDRSIVCLFLLSPTRTYLIDQTCALV